MRPSPRATLVNRTQRSRVRHFSIGGKQFPHPLCGGYSRYGWYRSTSKKNQDLPLCKWCIKELGYLNDAASYE